MLKGTLKLLRLGYINSGQPLLLIPKKCVELYRISRQDIADDKPGLAIFRIVAVSPYLIIPFPFTTGVGIIGGAAVTIGGSILLPIAATVEVVKFINKLKLSRPEANNINCLEKIDLQKRSYTHINTILSETSYAQTYIDDVKLSGSDTASYIKLLEDYVDPVTLSVTDISECSKPYSFSLTI